MSYARASLGTTSTPLQDEAKLLYDNGAAFFTQGRYDVALNAFQQAYRTISNPIVLIAIGQTYERLARWNDALAQYRAYLVADPNGPQAERAHERIATLVAPEKTPSGQPAVPTPVAVPVLVPAATAVGPKVSGVVIAVAVGLVAIAGFAVWRSQAVRRNRRRVRRNGRPWTHDTEYAMALRDLERSKAKLRQRL